MHMNQIGNFQSTTVHLNHVVTEPIDPSASTVKPRNRCCPYNFDSSLCKMVGDRFLCGYNMNKGRPYDNHGTILLNDGCRLRNGRLECGYQTGPFTNPRRPPKAWNDLAQYSAEKTAQKISDEFIEVENHVYDPVLTVTTDGIKLYHTKQRPRRVTRCVEIQSRIVCRQL